MQTQSKHCVVILSRVQQKLAPQFELRFLVPSSRLCLLATTNQPDYTTERKKNTKRYAN